MPVRAISRRLRNVKRHFGITAPRMVVRTQWPRQWIFLAAALFLSFLLVLGWLAYEVMQSRLGGDELQRLRQTLIVQEEELALLRSTAGTGQNAVSIERATQQKLLLRVAELEHENSQLREDLLLFERLVPAVGKEGGLRIESFRIQADGGGHYRYRIFLAFQGGRQAAEFKGRLQLLIKYSLAGRVHQITIPVTAGAAEYQVEIRNFQRREGAFSLPEGAVVTAAEARVMQGDTLKAKKNVQL